jgi:hypothetical protein
MWMQIVGKVKLELSPFLNEWWNVAFVVTARGLSTATIPFGQRMFQVDFDFIDHRMAIHVTDAQSRSMPLVARSVADFYAEFMSVLESLGIQVKINTHPVEVDDGIPFEDDRVHAAYDPLYVNRCWRILLGSVGCSIGTVPSRNAGRPSRERGLGHRYTDTRVRSKITIHEERRCSLRSSRRVALWRQPMLLSTEGLPGPVMMKRLGKPAVATPR